MKKYGIFTKFVVLQEPRSKETKRARKAVENTKSRRKLVATFNQLLQKNKRQMAEKLLQQKLKRAPGEILENCRDNLNFVTTISQKRAAS